MVNGLYRGAKAKLLEINTDKFQALVSMRSLIGCLNALTHALYGLLLDGCVDQNSDKLGQALTMHHPSHPSLAQWLLLLCQVRLQDGPSAGKEVWQEYEDICKLA